MSRDHQDAGPESRENRPSPQGAQSPVLIWDLPTRVFHWTLAASFFIALATGDSDRFRDIHVFSGCVVLGLICFRVVWGFAGTRYARFRSFLFAPRAAARFGPSPAASSISVFHAPQASQRPLHFGCAAPHS